MITGVFISLLAQGQEQTPPLVPESQGPSAEVSAPEGKESEFNKLKALNQNIWFEEKFWEQDAGQLARQMGLSPESQTKYLSSYRSYQTTGLEIAGIKPFMASVYGDPTHPTELNLIFMNQGDFFGDIPITADRQKVIYEQEAAFKKEISSQEKSLLDRLTAALGNPKQSSFGVGSLKEKVYRWDNGTIAILLCVQPEKYIALRIWPKNTADAQGRPRDKTTDADLKILLKSNVEKRDNGDVIISQIPMIDQGPKGYCAPATYERVLRYLGLNVDLYTLANCGGTERGGGTYTDNLAKAIDDLLSRSGRDMEKNIPLNFNEITKWIDQGIPLIWSAYVTSEIEIQSNQFTIERASKGQKEWASSIKKYRLPVGFQPDIQGGHIRIIVGYNKASGEICYSDSWGPDYSQRWIPWEAGRAISQGSKAIQAIKW